MQFLPTLDHHELTDRLRAIRGDSERKPDAAVVIPVNAQGDLENVLLTVSDVAHYQGRHQLEVILVVNNYEPTCPPEAIDQYRELGLTVVAIPNVRRPGEAPGFSARIPGVKEAACEAVVLFDADCRLPCPTELLDWYVEQFQAGAAVAYSPVLYYDHPDTVSLRVRFAIHHASRWMKRNLLQIPTTRGSNYAVRRSVMLELYERGMLADEMNVGPTFKAERHKVAYSGDKCLSVYTSGRMFSSGWLRMVPYYWYRLTYNLRTLPVRANVAKYTGRERDPVRRYVNNRPVR